MPTDHIKLYRTIDGHVVEIDGKWWVANHSAWDDLFNRNDLFGYLQAMSGSAEPVAKPSPDRLLAPIGSQEVWGAGVTYMRSRVARVAESHDAGGGDFYDRVYDAVRPEIFMKATSHRVVGPGQDVRIRSDSSWSVPEPELTLAVNAAGHIVGYTVGNDMSARDIEGQNPLYLPQAKSYNQCCALGPCILLTAEPLPPETAIRLDISRDGATVFSGETSLASMKRTLEELVEYLFRDNSHPTGCFLMTGTGIIPPDDFSLRAEDQIEIEIESIGVLHNKVVQTGSTGSQPVTI